MSNEMMRIYLPLKITIYPEGEYGVRDDSERITPAEAVEYEEAILVSITF